MNRRSFLRVLGLGATAAAGVAAGVVEVDLDRLLWVPGRKTIFLPSVEVVTPVDEEFEILVGSDGFTRRFTGEALEALERNLVLARTINRDYDRARSAEQEVIEHSRKVRHLLERERARYGNPFHAIEPAVGATLNVRLPKRFA